VTRNWRKLRESVTEERAFTYLLKEQKQRGKWLPVSRYIGGYYSGLRNFTWWTTVEMPTTKTMCTAHHLGLLNNNVGTEALILRCRADFIREKSLTYIPSTIDAFFSNIFYATQDEADCGRAISVENPKQLRLGAEEFVSEPINIEESGMELCPLLLEDTHQVYLEDIFDSLIRFYTDLIELENT
jgi:hypothetical protein